MKRESMTSRRVSAVVVAIALTAGIGACAKKKPPVARPIPPPPAASDTTPGPPPKPPEPVRETPMPPEPLASDPLTTTDIDLINKNSPFQPVFYAFDSAEVDANAQKVLNANADILRKYPTWVLTIEGHSDERGTGEYNLALGERRASAARTYLVSLGIPADRLKTVSYGKEFPFDPGHDESAWARNRRAHFVVTSK
jgi:peptidoglycan-associated lipoprotein